MRKSIDEKKMTRHRMSSLVLFPIWVTATGAAVIGTVIIYASAIALVGIRGGGTNRGRVREDFMPERLVDIERKGADLLHTFPVAVDRPAGDEEAFKQKALEAAAHARLVPNEELENLTAKIHVSRGGPLTPYGDRLGVLAETKAGLDQSDRDHAYFLWEQAGRPEGRADDFWRQAQYQRFCERAYAMWEREGCPEGKADEHWYRTRAFEES